MDIGQLVQKSMAAKQEGIPVNWEELCVIVLNAAVQRVRELEAEVQALAHPTESLPALDDLES